jgi:pentatricopeptide repeat protein
MSKSMPFQQHTSANAPRVDEQSLLDAALDASDGLLLDSLRRDDRRRRRILSISFLLGGIAMVTTLMAVFAGWLTFATTTPGDAAPAAAPSANQSVNVDEWITRLKGLHDHMHTAFGVGPDLTTMDPDQGVAIVSKAWPQLKQADVKTGLLKAFAFGKELAPKKHPKLFVVLNLGMTDRDSAIRTYAAEYLKEYSGKDFSHDLAGYKKWYKEFGSKTPEEVLQLHDTAIADSATSGDSKALTAKGWQEFNAGNSSTAEANFRAALEKNPEDASALNGLGFCVLNAGNAGEAKELFQKCLKLQPDALGAMNGLARCLKEEGKVDEAIDIWEKMHKKLPGPNAAASGLATTYLERREYAKAVPYFEELVKAMPDNPDFKQGLESAIAGSKNADSPANTK